MGRRPPSAQGAAASLDLRPVIARRLTLTGSAMGPRSVAERAALAAALRERVRPLLEAGRCKPWIYRVFPPDQAGEAQALMESSKHIGKIVLEVRPQRTS